MRVSYVLPDPASYSDWGEFKGDLACMRVPVTTRSSCRFPTRPCLTSRVRYSLEAVGYPLCAFQTGSTYSTRGNCLSTADDAVRRRTIDSLKSFVDLAARWDSTIVFGSLQGRLTTSRTAPLLRCASVRPSTKWGGMPRDPA